MTIVIAHLARKLFLISLLLLVPGVSFAVQEAAPVPSTEAPAPLSLLDTPPQARERVHPACQAAARCWGWAAASEAEVAVGGTVTNP